LKRFALLLTVICVLMLHFPAQIFAASASLTDPYDFLLPEEKQDLAMMASAVSDTHGLDVIMAVELTENGLLNTAADYYYENLHSHAERAVVLVIDPEYADMALKAYGTAANIFNQIWVDSFIAKSEERLQWQDCAGILGEFLLDVDAACRSGSESDGYFTDAPMFSNGDIELDIQQKVYDYASLLTDSEEESLAAMAEEILSEYKLDTVIVTTSDAEGKSSMEYADDFYDYNGFGYGETYDGLLLLIDMENRMVWLSTCGSAIQMFSDSRIASITDNTASYLSEADYYSGCNYALKDIASVARADAEMATVGGRFLRSVRRIPVYLLVGAAVGGIVIAVMTHQSRTARKAKDAAAYLDRGSMRLSVREDRYLHSTTTRTRIESSSGGGGGGSSSHVSSSGRSHGGGGSRF